MISVGKPSNDVEVNHPDWIPTLKLSLTTEPKPDSRVIERYCRVVNRGNKKEFLLSDTFVG